MNKEFLKEIDEFVLSMGKLNAHFTHGYKELKKLKAKLENNRKEMAECYKELR